MILDEVLDISRIEANKMGVDMSAFSPRDLLKSTVEFFAPSAESKGLLLTSTVSNTVPDRIVTTPDMAQPYWKRSEVYACRVCERGAFIRRHV